MPTTTGQTTLGAVRTAAQQRSDMVGSNFLTTSEWNANIQASQQELYGLLIQKFGNDYYLAGTPDNWYQLTTTATAVSYPLPDGSSTYKLQDNATTAPAFFKLVGVDLQVLGNTPNGWITLQPFMMAERNNNTALMLSGTWARRLRYRINGNTIWFTPQPAGGLVVRLWYIPRLTLPTADADVIDGVNGWEEYIVIDAAIKAMQKEESDCSLLMAQKAAIIARIDAEAESRDAGSPQRVTDTRRNDFAGMGSYGAGLIGWPE